MLAGQASRFLCPRGQGGCQTVSMENSTQGMLYNVHVFVVRIDSCNWVFLIPSQSPLSQALSIPQHTACRTHKHTTGL